MKTHGLLIDYKYCTGCHACEVSCRNEHDIPLEEWGIRLTQMGPMKLGGKWTWNYVPVPTDLCDLCIDRTEAGKLPACVLHCLGNCMEVVPVEEISAKMAEKGDTVVCFIP
ncbi:MAG: oxidoreductase [Coriobacteriia bacterium]|nr:oxidoreductase [Coriobacteriia bacterium]